MGTIRLAVLLLLTALLPACAVQTAAPTGGLRDDRFLPYREFSTPRFALRHGREQISGHLTARHDKATGAISTYAIVAVVYGQKLGRRYEAARNARAETLPFTQMLHDGAGCRRQAGCAHAEMFRIEVPLADLRAAATAGEGYPIKMFGRAGYETLYPIPKELVALLMAEIGSWSGEPVAAARSARRG
jgi:hypothetical protein